MTKWYVCIYDKLFDKLVEKYLPSGWKIVYEPFPDQDALGMADPDSKTIYIPRRKSVEVLLLFLHEVAHVVLGHTRVYEYHYMEDMGWRFELQAEQWAIRIARKSRVWVSPYREETIKAYTRRRYKKHLSVCRLYMVEPKETATAKELEWMGL